MNLKDYELNRPLMFKVEGKMRKFYLFKYVSVQTVGS